MRLIYSQSFGKLFLRELLSLAKVMQRHFLAHSIRSVLDFRTILGRHLVEQFLELSSHFHPPHRGVFSHSPRADRCSSKSRSAIGTNSSYHRSFPVLSPPIRSNAVRRESNANR